LQQLINVLLALDDVLGQRFDKDSAVSTLPNLESLALVTVHLEE
jgi:hypothetical protein